jgi:hypothetical protein
MTLTRAVALCAASLACGAPSTEVGAGALRVVVDGAPLEVVAGTTTVVQILVMGDGAGSALISSPGLPAFATLTGARLTLAPTREHEGDYAIALVATAGSSEATASLDVRVSRPNTAPVADENLVVMLDDGWSRNISTCPGQRCAIAGTPSVEVFVTDADGDPVTVELELVEAGQPFPGTATYATTSAAFPVDFPLPGLIPGTAYEFAIRARDAVGAWWASSPGGQWFEWPGRYTFTQGPCSADTPCWCGPTGTYCMANQDCCSGACSAAVCR